MTLFITKVVLRVFWMGRPCCMCSINSSETLGQSVICLKFSNLLNFFLILFCRHFGPQYVEIEWKHDVSLSWQYILLQQIIYRHIQRTRVFQIVECHGSCFSVIKTRWLRELVIGVRNGRNSSTTDINKSLDILRFFFHLSGGDWPFIIFSHHSAVRPGAFQQLLFLRKSQQCLFPLSF